MKANFLTRMCGGLAMFLGLVGCDSPAETETANATSALSSPNAGSAGRAVPPTTEGNVGMMTRTATPPNSISPRTTTEGTSNVRSTNTWSKDSWLRWGGPDGRMVASDTSSGSDSTIGWSVDWEATPPRELWRKEISIGFSSFTVQDGRVFTMGRDGDQDLIVALDWESGDEIWSVRLDVPLFDNLHEGGPGATPTLFEDKLITVSRDGQTRCLSQADGTEIWRADLSELTGIEPPEWGFTTSPWVGQPAGSETRLALFEVGSLVALDANDGTLVWKTEPAQPGYGSPTVFDHGGQPYVASLNNERLIVCRLPGGEQVAATDWESRFRTAAASPLIQGDLCFLSSGYQAGCAQYRFDGSGLELLYDNRNMSNHMNPCVLIDGTLYGIDGNSDRSRLCRLVALDWETGEELWAERGYGCGSVVGCGDRLVVLSDEGLLAVVRAQRDRFEEVARLQILEGRCWTVPVLVGNRLLARTAAGTVVALELPPVTAP